MNCCNRPTTTTQKELKSGLSLYRAAAAAAAAAEIIMMALVMMMMNDVKKKRKKARCASPSPGWPGKRKAACVLPPDDDDGHNGTMMKNTARRGSMDSSLGCGGLSGRIVSMRARALDDRRSRARPSIITSSTSGVIAMGVMNIHRRCTYRYYYSHPSGAHFLFNSSSTRRRKKESRFHIGISIEMVVIIIIKGIFEGYQRGHGVPSLSGREYSLRHCTSFRWSAVWSEIRSCGQAR